MILDIIRIEDGKDLELRRSDVGKAANVLSVQLGSLEYAQDFGVDLAYFLQEDIQFQNASFRSYLVQRLVEHQINVLNCIETVERFANTYEYSIGESADESKGLIA